MKTKLKNRTLWIALLSFMLVCTLALSVLFLDGRIVNAFADGYTVDVSGGSATVNIMDDAQLFENGNANKGGDNRYADNDHYFIYKANFGSVKSGAIAYVTVYNSCNRSLKLSSDNTNWTEVYGAQKADNGSEDNGNQKFNLITTDCVTLVGRDSSDPNKLNIKVVLDDYLSEDGSVYLRIGAHDTSIGWGGDLRALSFRVMGQYVANVPENGSASVNVNDESLCYDLNGTNTGNELNSVHRYADEGNYFVYRAKYDGQTGEGRYLKVFWRGGNRALYASADGENDTLIGCEGSDDKAVFSPVSKRGYYSWYDLAEYISNDGYVFVKFGARDTSRGSGADVFLLEFVDGAAAGFGQSAEAKVDMAGNEMVKEVSVTDFGAIQNGQEGISLIANDSRLMLVAKNTDTAVWKISLPDNVDASRTYLRVETRGEHNLLEVSADNTTYAELGKPGAEAHGASVRDGNIYYYSLTRFAKAGDLYLRFSSTDKKESGADAFLASLTVYASRIYDEAPVLPDSYAFDFTTVYAGDKEVGYYQEELSHRENPNNMDDAGYRYYDANSYGVYKLAYSKEATALLLVLDIRGGYRFSVSNDAKVWKDVLIGEVLYTRAQAQLPRDYVQINITSLVDAAAGTLYIRVGDASTDGGWGGAFTSMTLMTVYEKETSAPAIFAEGKKNTSVALYDPRLLSDGADKTANAYLGREIVEDGGYFTYKFALPSDARSFYLAMNQDNLSVTVGTDGEHFQAVDNKYILDETNGYGSMLTFSLTHLLESGKNVYVRFAKTTASERGILYTLYAGYNVTENAGAEYADRKVQAFLANDKSEEEYLHEYDYTQMGVTNKYKEFNRTSYAVYRFANDETAKAVKLIASIGNSFVLSISSDNVNWRDAVISDQQFYGNNHLSDDTVRDIYLDITEYATGEYIYVRVADLIDDNDCGAQLRGLGIITMKGDLVENKKDDPNASTEENTGCNSSVAGGAVAGVIALVGIAVCAVALSGKKKNS